MVRNPILLEPVSPPSLELPSCYICGSCVNHLVILFSFYLLSKLFKRKKKLNNRLLNRQFMLIWAGCTPLIELMATTLPSQVIDQECIDPL